MLDRKGACGGSIRLLLALTSGFTRPSYSLIRLANLPSSPPTVRIRGRTENMDIAAADLQHEGQIDPPERERAVDVKQITRQHQRGLCAQKMVPATKVLPWHYDRPSVHRPDYGATCIRWIKRARFPSRTGSLRRLSSGCTWSRRSPRRKSGAPYEPG